MHKFLHNGVVLRQMLEDLHGLYAYGMGHAQRIAMSFCQNSGATAYAPNCHIVGCQQVGYVAPAPVVAPPVYGQQFVCTAWDGNIV